VTRTINSNLKLHGEPLGRLSGDMQKYVHEKTVKSEQGKRKYPAKEMSCLCNSQKKKRVKLGIFASSA
jgi:hypothetical protein